MSATSNNNGTPTPELSSYDLNQRLNAFSLAGLDRVAEVRQELADSVRGGNNADVSGVVGGGEDAPTTKPEFPTFGDFSTPEAKASAPYNSKKSGSLGQAAGDVSKGEVTLVLVGGNSDVRVHGYIGNGTTICINPNCQTGSHVGNLKKYGRVEDGLYIRIGDTKLLSEPHVAMDVIQGSKLLTTLLDLPMSKDLARLIVSTLESSKALTSEEMDRELQECVTFYNRDLDTNLLRTPLKKLSEQTKAAEDTLTDPDVVKTMRKQQLSAALNMRVLDAKIGSETKGMAVPLIPMMENIGERVEELGAGCNELMARLDNEKIETKRKFAELEAKTSHLDGRVTRVEGSVGAVQNQVQLAENNTQLCLKKMIEVKEYLEQMPTSVQSVGAGSPGVSVEQVCDIIKTQLVEGADVISLNNGIYSFTGFSEVAELVDDPSLVNSWGSLNICPFLLLTSVANQDLSMQDLQQQQIHHKKTGYTHGQTLQITSGRNAYPGIFVSSSTSTANHNGTSTIVDFHRISSYPKFNKENNREGIAMFIRSRLGDIAKQARLEMERKFRDFPDLHELVNYLLNQSVRFIRSLLTFMEDKRRELLNNCHGPGPHTAQQEKSVWDLMLMILTVICDTLWVHRVEASQAYADPETATARYLYTAMKMHMEIEKLLDLNFDEHPDILPKLFNHIFEAFVSRSDHEALQAAFDKLKSDFKDLKALVDRLVTQMNGGGNGGGGNGGGGGAKKKQRRGKGAAKDEEGNED